MKSLPISRQFYCAAETGNARYCYTFEGRVGLLRKRLRIVEIEADSLASAIHIAVGRYFRPPHNIVLTRTVRLPDGIIIYPHSTFYEQHKPHGIHSR